ncbi:unnamed protein product, partial [Iphiclides podalirius]
MTGISAYLYCLCGVVAFTKVAAWTIDLEEVRKFFDDQRRKELEQHLSRHEDSYDYGGLVDGRSGDHYADGYAYESYMERKVHGIVRNGTEYLDGLKLAIENFKLTVENCSRANFTQYPGLSWNGTTLGSWNSSWVQGLDSNPSWPQILNISAAMLGLNSSNPLPPVGSTLPGEGLDRGRCANATREREKVRRLADLALWTTRQLQDRAMKGSYEGHDDEEIELLVRLAWFLEQLAQVTGFDPNADKFVKEKGASSERDRQRSSTEAPLNPLALPVPEEVKLQMISCLQQNSSVPATERCAIPVQLPPLLRMALSIPENNDSVPLKSSNATSDSDTGPSTSSPPSLETLDTVEDNQMSKLAPFRGAVKSVRKRSLSDVDEPALKKRSARDDVHRPLFDEYSKAKFGVHPVEHSRRLKDKSFRNDGLKSVRRRSVGYDRLTIRESEDPMQDISYYVKNKPGTNRRPSAVGAAEARLALERIFQTGNIEVVRRYGANYNPLVPSPFYFGVIKTISDI